MTRKPRPRKPRRADCAACGADLPERAPSTRLYCDDRCQRMVYEPARKSKINRQPGPSRTRKDARVRRIQSAFAARTWLARED